MKYKIRYWVKDRERILFHYLTTQETDKEKLLKHLKEDIGRTKEEIAIIEIKEVEEQEQEQDDVIDSLRYLWGEQYDQLPITRN